MNIMLYTILPATHTVPKARCTRRTISKLTDKGNAYKIKIKPNLVEHTPRINKHGNLIDLMFGWKTRRGGGWQQPDHPQQTTKARRLATKENYFGFWSIVILEYVGRMNRIKSVHYSLCLGDVCVLKEKAEQQHQKHNLFSFWLKFPCVIECWMTLLQKVIIM